MRKYMFSFCAVIVGFFLVMGCAGFLKNLQPARTFALTIDGEEIIITLPKDFPNMEEAIYEKTGCWDAKLCMTSFCLSDKPLHGHVRFFYSGKDVVALMWCPSAKIEECRQWLYTKGISVEVDYKRLVEFLDAIWIKAPGQKDVSFYSGSSKMMRELKLCH